MAYFGEEVCRKPEKYIPVLSHVVDGRVAGGVIQFMLWMSVPIRNLSKPSEVAIPSMGSQGPSYLRFDLTG